MVIRATVLRASPLCVHCKAAGRVSEAVEVDHITPLHKGGTDDLSNLAGLCRACHVDKTAKDMGSEPRTRFDAAGRVVW